MIDVLSICSGFSHHNKKLVHNCVCGELRQQVQPIFENNVSGLEYLPHSANVATRELALRSQYQHKAKADVRRYYKKCKYATKNRRKFTFLRFFGFTPLAYRLVWLFRILITHSSYFIVHSSYFIVHTSYFIVHSS